MIVSGVAYDTDLDEIELILLKMGHLFQFKDDYIDCFGDTTITGKIGTDIENGRCCALIITALGMCDERQRNILLNNYGIDCKTNIKVVKDIYEELNLKNILKKKMVDMYKDISLYTKKLDNEKTACVKIIEYIRSRITL